MKYLLAICLGCVALIAADPAKPEWVKLTRTGNATRLEWATTYKTNVQAFHVLRTIPSSGFTGAQTFTLGVPLLQGNGITNVSGLYHWNWTDSTAISTQTYFYAVQAVTVDGQSLWVQLPITPTINAPIKRN